MWSPQVAAILAVEDRMSIQQSNAFDDTIPVLALISKQFEVSPYHVQTILTYAKIHRVAHPV